jgi:hypothetical protein
VQAKTIVPGSDFNEIGISDQGGGSIIAARTAERIG